MLNCYVVFNSIMWQFQHSHQDIDSPVFSNHFINSISGSDNFTSKIMYFQHKRIKLTNKIPFGSGSKPESLLLFQAPPEYSITIIIPSFPSAVQTFSHPVIAPFFKGFGVPKHLSLPSAVQTTKKAHISIPISLPNSLNPQSLNHYKPAQFPI